MQHSHKSNAQELLCLATQRRTTTQRESESTSRRRLDIAKNSTIGKLAKPRHTSLLHRIRPIEHALLHSSPSVDFPDNALSDQLPHGWHTNHDARLECDDVALAFTDGLIREGLDAAEAGGHTREVEGQFDYVFEDVCEGEVGQEGVFVLEVLAEEGHDGADGGGEIGVGEDHTFGCTGCTTRVHDARHRLWLRPSALEAFDGLALASFAQLIEMDYLDGLPDAAQLCENGGFGLAIVDDEFDCRGIFEYSSQDGEEICVREDASASWFVERVGQPRLS